MLPLTTEELASLQRHRRRPSAAEEATCERYGSPRDVDPGKSRTAALLACYFALFQEATLSPGERAMVLVLAASDRPGERRVRLRIAAFLQNSPMLARKLNRPRSKRSGLKNGIGSRCTPTAFRSVRGRTLVAAILDEVSFWRTNTSATHREGSIQRYVAALSRQTGCWWGSRRPTAHGVDVHEAQAYTSAPIATTRWSSGASRVFNRTLSADAIQAQREADPTAARSEWRPTSEMTSADSMDLSIDRPRHRPQPSTRTAADGSDVFYRAYTDRRWRRCGGDAYAL